MRLGKYIVSCSALAAAVLIWACASREQLSTETMVAKAPPSGQSAPVTGASGWGYTEENGPKNWCGLNPSYTLCCEGMAQAPVNLTLEALEYRDLPKLQFVYKLHSELEVEHNGHTVEAKVLVGEGELTIGDKPYTLLQFHFHTQSEHTVGGHELPIEMHLVHRAKDGALAVVGVFIINGPEHRELQKIWAELPQHEGDHHGVHDFDLNKILPYTNETFRYGGSLTTPPCTESVTWNLFAQPLRMSPAQIAAVQTLFSGQEFPHGNHRSVLPLNGRRLLTDLKPEAMRETLQSLMTK